MEEVQQICINSPAAVASLVAYGVVGASFLANLVPSPDEIKNPVAKFLSRVLHFVAVDIVTAAKK